ncbi:hypothetical protein PY365_01465 [Roseiarcaceae bacterium H3SJ34-1]|uniref:hypothetical protein n=1 Tax=Terripilifer ovatus TaxID=3032367 RepID=UPI003AB9B086|nr:hypothetical protein [Roseiarcaceae bacterium H3SJ34-1]
MAQLSEADKKQLLGENYQEAERLAEISDKRSTQQRATESLRGNCEQVRNYALVIAGIAAIIMVTNYLQVSGPYQPYLGIGMAAAVVAAAICASVAQMVMRRRHN